VFFLLSKGRKDIDDLSKIEENDRNQEDKYDYTRSCLLCISYWSIYWGIHRPEIGEKITMPTWEETEEARVQSLSSILSWQEEKEILRMKLDIAIEGLTVLREKMDDYYIYVEDFPGALSRDEYAQYILDKIEGMGQG